MRLLKAVLRFIYTLYAATTFIAIMLVIFPFVIIASFFGRIRGGNMIYWLCQRWGDLWFPLIGIFCSRKFEVPHDTKKPYIFVVNHLSYLDAAFIVKAFPQVVRPLGKVELSKVPVFGFIYKNAIVTVDRDSSKDRGNSVRVLKSLIAKGISVLVFPEGTFNMTHQPLKEFYNGAFRVAIETQTPIKPVLFLDTYDRMPYHFLFSMTPGRCRAIYLDEIPVEGLTLKDLPVLKEKVFAVMEEKLVAYNASWIKTA